MGWGVIEVAEARSADAIVPALIEVIRPYAKGASDDWDASTEIASIGIDSFDFVEILFKLEERYEIDIDYNVNSSYAQMATIGDIAAEIEKRLAAKRPA